MDLMSLLILILYEKYIKLMNTKTKYRSFIKLLIETGLSLSPSLSLSLPIDVVSILYEWMSNFQCS